MATDLMKCAAMKNKADLKAMYTKRMAQLKPDQILNLWNIVI